MTASFYFVRLSCTAPFGFAGRFALAAECVGNEEIKHLAMMITSFLQEGAGVFAFCQNCNIKSHFISVVLKRYPSTYIQKGDET